MTVSRIELKRPFRSARHALERRAAGISRLLRELFRSPQSAIGTLIVLFFLLLALAGSRLAPYTTNDQSSPPQQKPTLELGQKIRAIWHDPERLIQASTYTAGDYPFGTDYLGRDVYSRVILGTKSIFRTAGLGTLLAVLIGTVTGLIMGYSSGIFDEIVGRLIDALLALPALLIALVILGIVRELHFERGSLKAEIANNSVLLVIALVYAPIVARVVRGATLNVKAREFVQAAQIRGESRLYILFREIFPSVIPALVVEASLRFSYAIFLVASLGFLGFAARPPSPDWGLMVSDMRRFYTLTPWALEYPAGAIALLVVGVNLMSDGVRRSFQRSE